ncbi:MAG: hypothetical protein AVDCRST_MAG69-2017, partial [uncultured Solirubrobacteraceae bacterium]
CIANRPMRGRSRIARLARHSAHGGGSSPCPTSRHSSHGLTTSPRGAVVASAPSVATSCAPIAAVVNASAVAPGAPASARRVPVAAWSPVVHADA